MSVWYHAPVGHVVMVGDHPAQHWVLQLIADYSVLQSAIEMIVDSKLALGTPAVAQIIHEKFLSRLTDDERWSLVKALAADCDYEDDLRRPSDAFWQAKRVRDLFAHNSGLPLVREPNSLEYFYLITATPKGIPTPLTPALVRQLSANCRWLRALVEHLGSLAGISYATFEVRERADGFRHLPSVEALAPPPLPIPPDWEPTGLTRETGESTIPVQQKDTWSAGTGNE